MKPFLSYILEKNRYTKSILSNTDDGRKKRAKKVKFNRFKKYTPSTTKVDEPLPKDWKRYEYECLSAEKTQNRKHQGYFVVDGKKSIRAVFCSCADHQFRQRYALDDGREAGVDTKNTYKNFTDIESHAPYTGDFPDIMNPKLNKFLCKHMFAALKKSKI